MVFRVNPAKNVNVKNTWKQFFLLLLMLFLFFLQVTAFAIWSVLSLHSVQHHSPIKQSGITDVTAYFTVTNTMTVQI